MRPPTSTGQWEVLEQPIAFDPPVASSEKRRGSLACRLSIYCACLAGALGPTMARAEPGAQERPSTQADAVEPEIVVEGKRKGSVDPNDLSETLSSPLIESYGLNSIKEVIDRLSERLGRSVTILVNGERVASSRAIAALPPEALAAVQVLKGRGNADFGLAVGSPVVNLVLRPRFRMPTIDAGLDLPTAGAGEAANSSLRYTRIDGETRLNAILSYATANAILESDRIDRQAAPPGGTSRYRSLSPDRNDLDLTASYTRPLGSFSLDVSSQLGMSRLLERRGLVSVPHSGDGVAVLDQFTSVRSGGAGIALSGKAGGHFVSLELKSDISSTALVACRQPSTVAPGPAATILPALPADTLSDRRSTEATAGISGTFFKLPAGKATFDGLVLAKRIEVRNAAVATPIATNTNTDLKIEGGITVPVLRARDGLPSLPGDLITSLRLIRTYRSGSGRANGASASIDWTVRPPITITFSRTASEVLPDPGVLFDPVVYRPGSLIYDQTAGTLLPVTFITGGNPFIAKSRTFTNRIQLGYQDTTSWGKISTVIGYGTDQTRNPVISIGNPSTATQFLIPGLFTKDANGAISSFDTRPFNGVFNDRRSLDISLNVNRSGSQRTMATGADGNVAQPGSTAVASTWEMSFRYEKVLKSVLGIGSSANTIDLLETPLNISDTEFSRDRVTVQSTFGNERFGLDGTLSWAGGARVRATNDAAGLAVRYSPVLRINVKAFRYLGGRPSGTDAGAMRLTLAVTNLLDRRIRVSGYPGVDGLAQGVLIDPSGRTISMMMRRSF